MKLFLTLADDITLWPYFVSHYTKLGVDEFYIASTQEIIDKIRNQSPCCNIIHILEKSQDALKGNHHAKTIARSFYCSNDEWHLIADLDEFHEYDRPLNELIKEATLQGSNPVVGSFIESRKSYSNYYATHFRSYKIHSISWLNYSH